MRQIWVQHPDHFWTIMSATPQTMLTHIKVQHPPIIETYMSSTPTKCFSIISPMVHIWVQHLKEKDQKRLNGVTLILVSTLKIHFIQICVSMDAGVTLLNELNRIRVLHSYLCYFWSNVLVQCCTQIKNPLYNNLWLDTMLGIHIHERLIQLNPSPTKTFTNFLCVNTVS